MMEKSCEFTSSDVMPIYKHVCMAFVEVNWAAS